MSVGLATDGAGAALPADIRRYLFLSSEAAPRP